MSTVFSDLKPKNSASRNGFDLSRRSVFSTRLGVLKPVFVQPTLPDSDYKIDLQQLMRTQPLQTAAFTGFKINYDFVFVPNNFGYTSFNEFIAQRKDEVHVNQPSNLEIPVIDLHSFVKAVVVGAIYEYFLSLQYTYSEFNSYFVVGGTYNTAHYSLFRNYSCPQQQVCLSVIDSLDMFGYGNYLPLVKYLCHTYFTEFSMNEVTSTEQFLDYFSDNGLQFRFTDFFNNLPQVIDTALDGLLTNIDGLFPNLWPVLAYNHAFYDFYRNVYYDDKFEVEVVNESSFRYDYVSLFNFDDYVQDYFVDLDDFNGCRLLSMFIPKNHLYNKDLFTAVLPSTQFGDVSVMVDNRSWLALTGRAAQSQVGTNPDVELRIADLKPQSDALGTPVSARQGAVDYAMQFRFNPGLAISVLESRRAEAMQRWQERQLRAGNRTKDVFQAQGWSQPKSSSSHQTSFIGSFDGSLDINTVAATVSSDTVELGQLGANGVCVVQGKELNLHTSDFGIILGILYITKDAEYNAVGLERHLQLTEPFDYPYPVLQNISLKPISYAEFNVCVPQAGLESAKTIIGYLPSFMEYKTALDKVHDEFFSSVDTFRIPGYPIENFNMDGVFSDWVTPRSYAESVLSKAFLYVQPDSADNVFKQAITGQASTNPFLVNLFVKCRCVEPLSVIGLPI